MEAVQRRRSASVAEILAEIADPPGYSALRCTVNILERKGFLAHVRQGKKYVYSPTTPRRQALRGALRQLLSTYFDGSPVEALSAIVALHRKDLSAADIEQLRKLVRSRRGRKAPP
jgi:BlaI family penicillinase repressor